MTTTNDAQTSRTFVYLGLTPIKTGYGVALQEVDADDQLIGVKRYYLTKKELKHRTVGGIYRINAGDNNINLASITYVKMHPDSAYVLRVRVEADMNEMQQRIEKLEKTAHTRDVLAETLAPLRAAYLATDALGKRCIEALVLNALRRG